MARTYTLNIYDEEVIIQLKKTEYETGHLAIIMENWDEEYKYFGEWDTLTTNFPMIKSGDGCVFIQKDKYLDFVLKNNLGVPTLREVQSGFNTYAEVLLNEDVLNEMEEITWE